MRRLREERLTRVLPPVQSKSWAARHQGWPRSAVRVTGDLVGVGVVQLGVGGVADTCHARISRGSSTTPRLTGTPGDYLAATARAP